MLLRKRLASGLALVPVLLALVTAGLAQEATRADFEEFCQIQQGRFVGEVTWVADWPGSGGKKGDKVTGYYEGTITDDGNVLLGKFYGGSGSTTLITVYDAGAKQIKSISASSGGTVFITHVYKQEGKWVEILTGSNPDGGKIEAKNFLTVSDDGKTLIWTGTGTIDGKKIDDLNDVWRKVSK